MSTRAPACLAVLVLTLAACGPADDDGPRGASDSPTPAAASSTPEVPAPVDHTGEGSGPADLVLERASVVAGPEGERLVLRFAGGGLPGWAARYVDEAVLDGSGEVVDLDGEAILQLDVHGTPTQVPGDGTGPPGELPVDLAGDVVDVRTVGAFEGVTQVFVGLRGGPAPFEGRVLADPTRLVVDLRPAVG